MYQIIEHAFVQRPFPFPALPHLLVVVLQALPVFSKFLQAMLVDVC
jgi:hypothetical protein